MKMKNGILCVRAMWKIKRRRIEPRKPQAQLIRWQGSCQGHENQTLFFTKLKSTFVQGYHFIIVLLIPALTSFFSFKPRSSVSTASVPPKGLPQEAQKHANAGWNLALHPSSTALSFYIFHPQRQILEIDRALPFLHFEFLGSCHFKPDPSCDLNVTPPWGKGEGKEFNVIFNWTILLTLGDTPGAEIHSSNNSSATHSLQRALPSQSGKTLYKHSLCLALFFWFLWNFS